MISPNFEGTFGVKTVINVFFQLFTDTTDPSKGSFDARFFVLATG
jgi:hypothetical protein